MLNVPIDSESSLLRGRQKLLTGNRKQEKRNSKGGGKIAEEFVKEREGMVVPSGFCIIVFISRSCGVRDSSVLQ